jgi:hypothetical protein
MAALSSKVIHNPGHGPTNASQNQRRHGQTGSDWLETRSRGVLQLKVLHSDRPQQSRPDQRANGKGIYNMKRISKAIFDLNQTLWVARVDISTANAVCQRC